MPFKMKQKSIITALLAIIAMMAQAQETIWNNVVMGYANAPIIKVNRVAQGIQGGGSYRHQTGSPRQIAGADETVRKLSFYLSRPLMRERILRTEVRFTLRIAAITSSS